MHDIDLLIGGAGPVGCTVAERAASQLGWRCMVVDRRDHIGGLCHDRLHPSGVLTHIYGPHYFRTNNKSLVDYLSQFTSWVQGNYIVKSSVQGILYPIPINLTTLEQFFGRSFDESSAKKFLEKIREPIPSPKNSEEFVLSKVGRELYEAFYLGYTLKQWGRHPRELDPSVCGRIPIRFNRDDRYVDHQYQILPAQGFTKMFEAMVSHPNIDVRLKTDFFDVAVEIKPRFATVYTGAIDEYFGCRLGKLPWRSLRFQFEYFPKEFKQPCVQINFPNDYDYTRSVEIKHTTRQQHSGTVIAQEFPQAEGDPYYPIPAEENHRLFREYQHLAEEEWQSKAVLFAGRLAQYCYINSDQAIEIALKGFEDIKNRFTL